MNLPFKNFIHCIGALLKAIFPIVSKQHCADNEKEEIDHFCINTI